MVISYCTGKPNICAFNYKCIEYLSLDASLWECNIDTQ